MQYNIKFGVRDDAPADPEGWPDAGAQTRDAREGAMAPAGSVRRHGAPASWPHARPEGGTGRLAGFLGTHQGRGAGT